MLSPRFITYRLEVGHIHGMPPKDRFVGEGAYIFPLTDETGREVQLCAYSFRGNENREVLFLSVDSTGGHPVHVCGSWVGSLETICASWRSFFGDAVDAFREIHGNGTGWEKHFHLTFTVHKNGWLIDLTAHFLTDEVEVKVRLTPRSSKNLLRQSLAEATPIPCGS